MAKFHVMIIPPAMAVPQVQFMSEVYEHDDPEAWLQERLDKVIRGDEPALLFKDMKGQAMFFPGNLLSNCICGCIDDSVLQAKPPEPKIVTPGPAGPGPVSPLP